MMVRMTSEKEMMQIENEFYAQGYSVIAGVDDAGCGEENNHARHLV